MSPADCSNASNQCFSMLHNKAVDMCHPDDQCWCVEGGQTVTVETCMGAGDCRTPGDKCFSEGRDKVVDMCDMTENCFCVTGSRAPPGQEQQTGPRFGHYERCDHGSSCEGGPCVKMASQDMMWELGEMDGCNGDDCFCIPCYEPVWFQRGCERFETITSSCRGALLANVTEVCGDPCKVHVPAWVAHNVNDGTCEGYCHAHGLTCRGAHTASPSEDESVCSATTTMQSHCWDKIEQTTVCECKGMNTERRIRPGPDHAQVDECWASLDRYEQCIWRKPELHSHFPDPAIRAALTRERSQKCIDIPQDVFDKYNVVGCSARR